jgi:hypothetical protein
MSFRFSASFFAMALVVIACVGPIEAEQTSGATQNGPPFGASCTGARASCPDFTTSYSVGRDWRPPTSQKGFRGLGAVRVEYNTSLKETVAGLIFGPDAAENEYGRISSQALAIVLHIRPLLRVGTTLVDAAAFWYDGETVRMDHYIFVRAKNGVWRRNASSSVSKLVSQAHI